jgi:hypothetical protein
VELRSPFIEKSLPHQTQKLSVENWKIVCVKRARHFLARSLLPSTNSLIRAKRDRCYASGWIGYSLSWIRWWDQRIFQRGLNDTI